MLKSINIISLAAALSSCSTMVTFEDARQAAAEYEPELELICAFPNDYGELIDSLAAREAWRAEAERTPGLERLAGVWAFEERKDIDTGLPKTVKAIVVPGTVFQLLQARRKVRRKVDEFAWGTTIDGRYSIKCEGSRGYIVAFFDK